MVTNNYPNTGSTLAGPNGINKTSTALSTNIIVKVNGIAVGAIQTIGITESRSIKAISEVGTDGIIDSAPSASTTIAVNCTRIRFDKLRIAQAFSRGFIHASAQRYPFDIEIYDIQSDSESNRITTVIKNCWINQISYTYNASDWVISESMNCNAETIYSHLTGNAAGNPVGTLTSVRGVIPYSNVYEQAADSGARRGALDASGLIDLGSPGSPEQGPF